MSQAPERVWWKGGLGPWVLGPLVGLGLIVLAIYNLPGSSCGEEDVADGAQRALLVIVTCAASLAVLAAAAARLVALSRRPLRATNRKAVLAGFVFVLAVVCLVAGLSGDSAVGPFLILAALVTGGSLVILLLAWAVGRRPDDVGFLIPAYLLGSGLVAYPLLTLFALAVESGGFC
jgi:hypothetical protein